MIENRESLCLCAVRTSVHRNTLAVEENRDYLPNVYLIIYTFGDAGSGSTYHNNLKAMEQWL
jgi:hypothetical protein